MYFAHEPEGEGLLAKEDESPQLRDIHQSSDLCGRHWMQDNGKQRVAFVVLACVFFLVSCLSGAATVYLFYGSPTDPSLRLYCRSRLTVTWSLSWAALLILGPLALAPVNHLVEYVPTQFKRSRGEDKTLYQGWPSDEIDRQWEDSYSGLWPNCPSRNRTEPNTAGMLSTIDAKTAGLLPENTERLPLEGREDEFVVTLDIFHQMHCLDIIRMSLYRDRYDKHIYFPNGTVDYCKWLHVGK